MKEDEKHCDTCRHSYLEPERTQNWIYLRQKCSSPDYNSSNNIHDSIMEDWGQGYCRFWPPQTERTTL